MRLTFRHQHEELTLDVSREGAEFAVTMHGLSHRVTARVLDPHTLHLVIEGRSYLVHTHRERSVHDVWIAGETYRFVHEAASTGSTAALALPQIIAPMPGKVLQVLVQPRDHVDAGDGLLILEAMKMENRLVAEAAGTVNEVRVAAGDMVEGGQVLIVLAYDQTKPA